MKNNKLTIALRSRRTPTSKIVVVAAIAVSALNFATASARAAITRWQPPGDDYNWDQGNNWSNGVPNSNVDARIDQSTAYVDRGINYAKDLFITGDSGDDGLFVRRIGQLYSSNTFIGLQNGGIGFAYVSSGGEWRNTGDYFIVGHQGVNGNWALTVEDGLVAVPFGYAIIGDYAGVRGTVSLGDRSAKFIAGRELRVGNAGIGQMDVYEGALASSNGPSFVGYTGGSQGIVTVDGRGSLWANADILAIGGQGHGTLTLRNQAVVSSENNMIIGNGESARGFVRVEGGIASFEKRTSLETKGHLIVGDFGHGELAIVSGGRALNYGSGLIGAHLKSFGEVIVSGADSNWVNVDDLIVGREGVGFLTVNSGGRVFSNDGQIGDAIDSEGYVRIERSDSTWTGSGELHVGGWDDGGTGTLTLASGGTVRFPHVHIRSRGTVEGQGTIFVAPGGFTNEGMVSPSVDVPQRAFANSENSLVSPPSLAAFLEGIPGGLRIDGDYTQTTAGSLVLGVASSNSYATLDVTGHASLDGTLKLEFLGGFVPQAGQSFNFLHAGSMSGQFTTFDLPKLGGGLTWDTTNFYSDGALAVTVPEPAAWFLVCICSMGILPHCFKSRKRVG